MPAESPLGKIIERGYARGGAMDLHQVMSEIQSFAGSDRKAAKLVGVHHHTWQRWRYGQNKPNILHLLSVGAAVRKVRAESRPFRADQLVLKVRGNDGRKRTIAGRQLGFNLSHEAAIERTYVSEGADAAAAEFIRQLRRTDPGRSFYADYFAPLARVPDDDEDLFDDLRGEESSDLDEEYSAAAGSASW